MSTITRDDGDDDAAAAFAHLDSITDAERAALLLLSYDQASVALEADQPAAVAIATEFVLQYSEQAGLLLEKGEDYLELLTPKNDTPAIERIAMEVVRDALEEQLDNEDVDE